MMPQVTFSSFGSLMCLLSMYNCLLDAFPAISEAFCQCKSACTIHFIHFRRFKFPNCLRASSIVGFFVRLFFRPKVCVCAFKRKCNTLSMLLTELSIKETSRTTLDIRLYQLRVFKNNSTASSPLTEYFQLKR